MNYPKRLKKGDTIALVCPSSPVSEERAAACRAAIEAMGYQVKAAPNLATSYAGYMADKGAVRGFWINAMFADPEVDALFCVRGGNGGSRVMEYLDLDLIQKNPKIFVGYSDVTGMHLAFTQKCGFVTFHGPMVASDMVDGFDAETRESFFRALNAKRAYAFRNPNGQGLRVLKKGKAKGLLTGGNLSLLAASLGTPYEVDTRGKILFLEEVGEPISRMDRSVYQLRNAGKFQACAGILLGQFTDCVNKADSKYTELECFGDALEGLSVPVLFSVQSGHGQPMMCLPLGADCTMDTEKPGIFFAGPKRESGFGQ